MRDAARTRTLAGSAGADGFCLRAAFAMRSTGVPYIVGRQRPHPPLPSGHAMGPSCRRTAGEHAAG
jgi:hypothetical protein